MAQRKDWMQRRVISTLAVGFMTTVMLFLGPARHTFGLSLYHPVGDLLLWSMALILVSMGHLLLVLLPAVFLDQMFRPHRLQRIFWYLLVLGWVRLLCMVFLSGMFALKNVPLDALLWIATWGLLFWGTEALIELVPFSVIQASRLTYRT